MFEIKWSYKYFYKLFFSWELFHKFKNFEF